MINMDAIALDTLQNGKEDSACRAMRDFTSKHGQSFSFPDFNKEAKQQLVSAVLGRLHSKASPKCYTLCLEIIRILSREKTGLEVMVSEDVLKALVKHSGLQFYAEETGENVTIQNGHHEVMTEAQKCLCNIIFNSPIAQRICCMNGCVEGIVQRLKTYKDPDLVFDIKFYDMRILFLMTALCTDIRPKVKNELHGFTYLIEVLDLTLRVAEERQKPLGDQEVDLSCEILKVLFNLTVTVDKNNVDEEEEAHFMRLVSVLHDLLLCDTASKDKQDEVQSHTVNLLTNMPRDCYEELLTPVNEEGVQETEIDSKCIEYDGKNVEAIAALLEFLERRLDKADDVAKEKKATSLKETLTPIIHCLCECCRANRCIRKFSRLKVLPYLKDEVKNLPEEGAALRNKLCKFLTSPVTDVKDLVADFLFVLCKEKVSRFIKYTGYGNAAGLLAQRGLMCGGRGASTEYSSESDDSETEEFSNLKNQVNPVTGRWEEPHPDPMAGMTDEEKEYEAIQLVNKLDRLQREGIIQPTRIGEDGKPQPVSHVLELLEDAQQSSDAHREDAGDNND